LLKPKAYLRKTSTLVGKVHQPIFTQVNSKTPTEGISPKENIKQVRSAEISMSKSEVKLESLEVINPDVKHETDQIIHISLTNNFTSENKESISIHTIISTQLILSPPKVKVYVSKNPVDYFFCLDSSPTTSSVYASRTPEKIRSSFPFPPHLYLPSPHDHFPELLLHHPKEVKISID
jgi:hypothetical protein